MDRLLRTRLGQGVLAGIVVACAACSPGAGPSVAPPATAEASAAVSADTTLVADIDVGGRTLHVVCLGPTDTGRPTVIFEHGLGGDFGVWADVLTRVSRTDRGCSYDRAGAGMSPPAPAPRTTRDQVADLRTLLDEAGIEPPYVLVGHSSGAYNVMVHAADHTSDVAGMVLVDPRPPSSSSRFLAALPPESASESDVIHQYRAGYVEWEADPRGNPEGLHLADSATEADSVRDLGSIPLTVLAATGDDDEGADLDPELAATFEGIWAELQAELATRSSAGRLVEVADASHDMPFDRPDAVAEAIAELIDD